MGEFVQVILSTLSRLNLAALIDVALVAAFAYWLLSIIQGTTAVMLVRGIAILLLVGSVLANLLNLTMLSWLIRNSVPAMLVAIPILFQPELRRALEQVGRAGGLLPHAARNGQPGRAIEVIATASRRLAERRWGALIVLERETALGEYAATGIELDAAISVELLLQVFYPNTPLHDGALIVRGDRAVAAGCVLPLAETMTIDHTLGTRHRAAVGITQRTDAVAIVVSEETGIISIANNGRLVRNLDEAKLRKVLEILTRVQSGERLPALLRGWGPQKTQEV